MPGQSGCRSRSTRRKFVRNNETLETVDGSCDVVVAAEVVEEDDVSRDDAWRGLLELAGGRSGLDRERGAAEEMEAMFRRHIV